jgi:hypothetical protein
MKYVLLFLFMTTTVTALAQEQTLISGDIESGGFGGPAVKITRLNGETGVLVGGRGGWIVNHKFVLGGGGYGLVTNVKAKTTDSIHQNIELGYGGLDLEYIASSDDLLHLSLGLLIGGGGIAYKDENDNFMDAHHRAMKGFFVLEPNVAANLNVTHFFRLAAGLSFRYINGLNSTLSTNADLSGPSVFFMLKFGTF